MQSKLNVNYFTALSECIIPTGDFNFEANLTNLMS